MFLGFNFISSYCRKQYLWLVVILTFQTFGFSQYTDINNLFNELKSKNSDTSQIRIYRDLSKKYSSIDPDKKRFFAKKYYDLAQKNNIDSLIVQGLIDIGISHGMKDHTDSALYYFGRAYDKSKLINYKIGLARSLSNIGYAYDRMENMEGAIKNNLGALELYKDLKNENGIKSCYLNLGSLYYDIHQYNLAEEYFLKALNLNIKQKDQAGIAHGYFTLGNVYKQLNNTLKAREFYDICLKMSLEQQNLSEIVLARWGIAQTDILEKKYKNALAQLQIAFEINKEIKHDYQKFGLLIASSEAYLGLGDTDKALTYALEGYNESKKNNLNSALSIALPMLVKIYKNTNNFKKALEYQDEFVEVLEKIRYDKISKDLILADLDRVRSENNNLLNDNSKIIKKNTNYFKVILATSLLLLLLIVISGLFYKKNRDKKIMNDKLQSQKDEIAKINLELEKLNLEIVSQNKELDEMNKVKNKFFSIVSHDLRSPLANLQMLFGLYREGQLQEKELSEILNNLEHTILNTANFLDNLLEWSKSQLDGMVVKPISFDVRDLVLENIDLLNSQIKSKSLVVENKIDQKQIVFADQNMIKVVLRNLISNAVKFVNHNDSIQIEGEPNHQFYRVSIKDSGPGISKENLTKLFSLEYTVTNSNQGDKGHQLGLILCKEMIEKNNGKIQVFSEIGKGTTFVIDLPIA